MQLIIFWPFLVDLIFIENISFDVILIDTSLSNFFNFSNKIILFASSNNF